MALTRRKLLSSALGTAGAGVLAGCLDGAADDGGSEANGATAQSSFFVFGDVASEVAGDVADAELLVPVGQHGHGWEPGPSVREDVHGADLFVHGMPGFQPWVDAITGDLEADDADVTPVDVTTAVDLLATDGGHDHEEDGHDGEHDDDEHTEHHDDEQTEHHDDEHTDGEHHDDEHTDGEHHDDEHDDGRHDHEGGTDPHFWMDPLRVKDAVGTVQQALVDVDPDNEDAYAENAEGFRSRLDDLHEEIASTVDGASTDTVLVAGHDSFQYLGDRYGVEVEALTDVSPDDQPTPRDIERAQAVIDDHGLQFICADPLESQEAAEQLVAETDAEAVLPLTAMPGLTAAWEEEGWGYVDVVENVNLPTLERALDV